MPSPRRRVAAALYRAVVSFYSGAGFAHPLVHISSMTPRKRTRKRHLPFVLVMKPRVYRQVAALTPDERLASEHALELVATRRGHVTRSHFRWLDERLKPL